MLPGQAPNMPRSLRKPNCTLSNAFIRYCWDIAFSAEMFWSPTSLLMMRGLRWGKVRAFEYPENKVGHSHAQQTCETPAKQDLKCPHRPSWPSVSPFWVECKGEGQRERFATEIRFHLLQACLLEIKESRFTKYKVIYMWYSFRRHAASDTSLVA